MKNYHDFRQLLTLPLLIEKTEDTSLLKIFPSSTRRALIVEDGEIIWVGKSDCLA